MENGESSGLRRFRQSAELPPVQRRFGAHMSIAGGLHHAFERAVDVGCDCMQIFVKNQRQWHAPPLADEQIARWQAARRSAGVAPVVAHATYLINLASPDRSLWKRSINACADELLRCERLGVMGLVFHPGSHLGQGESWGVERVAAALDIIHDHTPGLTARTILETTAGQGSCLGHRFEHLADIIGKVREPERLAVCVDTCHIFSAGYEITTDEGYAATLAALDRTVGLNRVMVFHMNDSLRPVGSRRDRHGAIGQHEIGRSAFRRVVTDPRFLGIPMILETPKGTDPRGRDLDRVNLAVLRRLVRQTISRAEP